MTDVKPFRIEQPSFAGNSIEAYCHGNIVTIEIDEPWAGSTETGFGQTCSLGLSLDEAEQFANYILEAIKKARGAGSQQNRSTPEASPRARLLAILKEPGPYTVRFWLRSEDDRYALFKVCRGDDAVSGAIYKEDSNELCADLNASHRLKMICDEIAKVAVSAELPEGAECQEDWRAGHWHGRRDAALAIRSLGEDNEHS